MAGGFPWAWEGGRQCFFTYQQDTLRGALFLANAYWVKRQWLQRVAEAGEKRWLWPRQARPQQSPCRNGSSFSPADTEEKDSTPRLGTWAPETLSWAVSTHRAELEPRLPVCT